MIVLSVEGGPDPPTNIQAHVISSRSIDVSWDESPQKFNRETIAYSVHYARTAGLSALHCYIKSDTHLLA